ncbi:hypothetical protein SLEP1_g34244 [Rubroshorea leprosula]|uniref:Uncharacterized protein n=1 Tax=Rubroshorea leprosula TaxID=152421 RepID=A0AAV5KJ69_9ROSI|nr:hypothetical protein SLEP1_g34244 [Rubroshorea leprosula]
MSQSSSGQPCSRGARAVARGNADLDLLIVANLDMSSVPWFSLKYCCYKSRADAGQLFCQIREHNVLYPDLRIESGFGKVEEGRFPWANLWFACLNPAKIRIKATTFPKILANFLFVS